MLGPLSFTLLSWLPMAPAPAVVDPLPQLRHEAVLDPAGAIRRGRALLDGDTLAPEVEREVLRCLAGGLPNAEIGRELFIGEGTVKTHVARILDKLELRDRVQAVVFAHRYGLAP